MTAASLLLGGVLLCLGAVTLLLVLLFRRRREGEWAWVTDRQGRTVRTVAVQRIPQLSPDEGVVTIRVALFCRGMAYLMKRPSGDLHSSDRWDVPFDFYYTGRQPLHVFVRQRLARYVARPGIELRYSLRYLYHDERLRRCVSLWLIYAEEERDIGLSGGKLWTLKQIESNREKGVFSPLFENEWEHYRLTLATWQRWHDSGDAVLPSPAEQEDAGNP